MPVRDLRRYGSQSSLGKNENAGYSLANDSAFSDRHDSVYQSSPELSQGSHTHTRSSSTDDSMDGSYYGNSHSRQSSSSTEGYATRLPAGGGRRTSTTTAATAAAADPLQFVKIKGADELAKTAAKQIEAAKETALMRPALRGDEGEPDWQSKLSGWKSRRKSASAAVYQRVGEVEGIFTEDEPEKPKTKTFSQITAEKEKRKSLGNLRSFYPMDDDDNFSTKLKEHDKLHIMKSEDEITQSTEIKLKKKAKGEEVAPWARDSSGEGDSQSDSETNISHQSGDTDNVFAEQTVSKVVNRDESWLKRTSSGGSQTSPSVRQTPPPVGSKSIKDRNMQLWENSAKESQSKMDKTKVDIPVSRSNNKIKNITKAFEEKESSAKAEPVIQRRSEYGRKSWSLDSTDSPFRRRSSDFSDKSDKSSPKGFNEKNVSPLLSPTSPKALLPKEQRPSPSNFKYTPDYSSNKKFIEKNIKISQAPNNSRGFGFFVSGGSDKREPVTVSKVSLGSSADISDVLMNDEVLSVNNHEVGNMTLKQVQGIIDHSVKRGQIELKIRRKPDEGSFDSLDEEGGGYLGGNNKIDTQSDSSSFSTDPLSDDASYKTPQSSARQTGSDDNEKPSLMDRLLAEKSREPNNNFDMSMYKSESKEDKPPSPVAVENLKAEISFSSHMTPSRRSPITQQKTEVSVSAVSEPPLEQPIYASSRESPVSKMRTEVSESLKSEPPPAQTLQRERDMVAPVGDTVVEERQTITMKPSPVVQDEPPVAAVRRRRTPEKQREEPKRETPPPAPPVGEAPPLPKSSDDESGGFGPPAALLRWQRPRAKSEHKVINPYTSVFDRQVNEAKRLSSTLPRRSEDSDNKDSKEVSKDDSVLSRVTKDFESTVSVSKPPLTKSRTYHFDDVSKIQDWDQKQEEERQYEPQPGRPVTPPPAFEVEIHKEEKLTPQEKFERDQQRIRQQYEEEKRRAKEAENQREQQEQKLIKKDSERLLNLESQIQPNKLDDIKPVHPPVQSKPPQFTSEPMTMKVPANSQGRHLVIDPRNKEESGDVPLPQYQFHVDLQKQEEKPKLRTLKQEPELTAEELLERERERIREEEHRKFEEEKRRWKEEQDEQLRREQERLKAEREAIEREKAKLEQRQEPQSRYQPVTIHTSPRSSWAGSPSSHSPKSPPPALDPHHRGSSGPSRKADIWAPPSTQTHHKTSKSDIGAKERARLTREDLLAMNRKATPLQSMNKRFEEQENKEPEPVAREAPSKLELHMLNSVPKPRFRRAADWIKDDEEESSAPVDKYATAADKYADKQFVIGNKSDIIHKDYSTSQDHWMVQEAERRRLADSKDYSRRFDDSVHTAGPAKPSGSSLVNRFRGDIEPNKKNRYSYPTPRDTDSHLPARPLSTSGSGLRHFERSASPELSSTQFSARNQSLNFANPSLSNTLPANFSFNANKPPKREPPAPAPKPKRSPTEQADQTHTVSGKQRCSHCEEELGFGAAMVIESLGLYYHVQCFRCCVCRAPLGSGSEGADVRVRVNKLHCRNCFSNDEAGLKFSKV